MPSNIYTYECYGFEFSVRINTYWETVYKGKPREKLYGAYTILLDKLLQTTDKKRIVLDIGANNGLFCIPANKLGFPVIGFEPVQETFDNLAYSLAWNKLENINIFNLALSNGNGVANIYVPQCTDNASMNEVAAVANMAKKEFDTEAVRIRRFDDWILENEQYSDIGFIKLDVQGHEFDIISGMAEFLKRSNDIYIACEFEPHLMLSGHTYIELENLFLELGFIKLKNLTGNDRLFYKQ